MRTRVIGCTVAIVLAAAACGASKASALEVVRGAASKTAAARTARIALTVELHNPGVAAGNATVSGTGVVDYGAKRGLLDMNIANAGRPVSTVKAVYTGTVLYMRIPQLATTLSGKSWLKLNYQQLASRAGVDIGNLGQLQSSDPTQGLEVLRGTSTDVRAVDHETVRGTSTTRYHGTVDLHLAAANATSAASRQGIERLIKLFGRSTIPVDVWIDGAGRLRRQEETLDLSKASVPGGAQTPASIILVVEYYDFGVPVHIVEPPADQVTDLGALMQSSSQTFSSSGTASGAVPATGR